MEYTNNDVIYIMILLVAIIGLFGSIYIYNRPRKYSDVRIFTSPQYIRGLLALLDDNKKEAFSSLRSEVQENPNNIDAYIRLSALFTIQKQSDKSIQILLPLTARTDLTDTEKINLYFALALSYKDLQKYDQAIKTLLLILDIDSEHLEAHKELFNIHELKKDWGLAFTYLKRIQKLENKNTPELLAVYLSEVGKRYLDDMNDAEALNYLAESLKHDKTLTPALLFYGDLMYKKGELKAAIEYWEKIISYHPEESFVLLGRIDKALNDLGKVDQVFQIYDRLSREFPHDIRYLFALSSIYRRKGEFQEALAKCKTALDLDPENQYGRLMLIDLYREMGDNETAWIEFSHVVNLRSLKEHAFICNECGYHTNEPLWHCPKCNQWKTFF